jgi:phosphoserine phosphatase
LPDARKSRIIGVNQPLEDAAMTMPPKLVAFDVDGTLLRGETICECPARGIGKIQEMRAFERLTSLPEIWAARRVMAAWCQSSTGGNREALLAHLDMAQLAPGARTGVRRLRSKGIKIAFVSISWKFAVEWLAQDLGADFFVGTDWLETGEVMDFWPSDKATWLLSLLEKLSVNPNDTIVIGDSAGDLPILKVVGRGYYVGAVMPEELPHVRHRPFADINDLVEDMIGAPTPMAF